MVLFQAWFLVVGVVALRATHHTRIFRPGLADTSAAKVVFARQLYRFSEYVQTYGANELLLEAIFPVFSHLNSSEKLPANFRINWLADRISFREKKLRKKLRLLTVVSLFKVPVLHESTVVTGRVIVQLK